MERSRLDGNISWNKMRMNLGLGLVFMCFLFFTCKQNENQKLENKQELIINAVTQAVLKVQEHTYDPQQSNLISGDYIDKKKIVVPKLLSTQNKWLMFEGPVLENDKVAYRYYADKRHRFDIYGKKVSDLVMDTVSWDYHNIMDWGSDILKVGNTLGIGSPAILYQDSIHCLENWETKKIEVITDGGETSMVRTTFSGLVLGKESMTIQQDWSLSTGNYFSTLEIKRLDGDLPDNMLFVTGIAKHLADFTMAMIGSKSVGYNWGEQSFHNQNLGMGIISDTAYKPRLYEDKLNHVIAFDNSQKGVKYQFISVWEDGIGNIDTKEKFMIEIDNSIKKLSKK